MGYCRFLIGMVTDCSRVHSEWYVVYYWRVVLQGPWLMLCCILFVGIVTGLIVNSA